MLDPSAREAMWKSWMDHGGTQEGFDAAWRAIEALSPRENVAILTPDHVELSPPPRISLLETARSAWIAADGPPARFVEAWNATVSGFNFDNHRALYGRVWETAWKLADGHGDGIDADPDLWFAVWWDALIQEGV